MTNEEEQALLKSIEHWKENVALHATGKPFLYGAEYCACCQLQGKRQGIEVEFGSFECFHETGNCVIADYTDQEACNGTPYYKVIALDEEEPPQTMLNWLERLHGFLTGKRMVGPDIWEDEDDY
jgi:hypothetical protein